MVYDHAVKAHGIFYPAGAEVPEAAQKSQPKKAPQKPRPPKKDDAV